MKAIKLLFALFLSVSITSCVVVNDDPLDDDFISLEEVVGGYDLWYVDFHRTIGTSEVPYLSRAFTVSFFNGDLYANNNIVDIGKTGNGLGILVGSYRTYNDGVIETRHNLDGNYSFEVIQISANEIRLNDLQSNVSYLLVGYQRNNFDYDMLFYDNIEYFLQEYVAWERTSTANGTPNPFDSEHFLQFTPENVTTFYSSNDSFGTDIDLINWDYIGSYRIDDIIDYNDLKFLTLYYEGGDTEEFELSVINDGTIELFHLSSNTTYVFEGRGFIQYLKGEGKIKKPAVRNSGRKRIKIERKKINRRV
ncbi:hypothetical protein BTO06_16220 [Tenacibaculum sp. SZ-18]|uniref:hypothetical protein n=1 Tax=Tenacibaculum sp. SZ-18 TaxID=754423 RepID=UPI000C2D2621|nr:hypothetical protein [Tenacibaculum sp. SZ-18]AUC16599.1 hypothetical protein BTO06_16220 [Tenacibaculum sp. SZ-18]